MPSCISSASMCDNICACTSTNLKKKLSNYIFKALKNRLCSIKNTFLCICFCNKTNILNKTNNKI